MSDLAADIVKAMDERGGRDCKVCWLLQRMDIDDRDALLVGLERLSAPKLSKILKQNGHDVSRSSVSRHNSLHAKGNAE